MSALLIRYGQPSSPPGMQVSTRRASMSSRKTITKFGKGRLTHTVRGFALRWKISPKDLLERKKNATFYNSDPRTPACPCVPWRM